MTHDDTAGHPLEHTAGDAPPSPDDTQGNAARFHATEEAPSPDADEDDVAGHVQPNRLRDRDH